MRLILLGCPGAGKGTQAGFIRDKYNIAAISTGDMLRAAIQSGTPLGNTVKQIVADGKLVPDDVMIALVAERIVQADCANGFLLDGFPRTIPQADALRDNHIAIDAVLEIRVPDTQLLARLSGRRVHPASGRVYHTFYHPPKVADRDDVTGEPLVQRPDDEEETVKKRIALYHATTEPLVKYYSDLNDQQAPRLLTIDGTGSVDAVSQRIFNVLSAVSTSD